MEFILFRYNNMYIPSKTKILNTKITAATTSATKKGVM